MGHFIGVSIFNTHCLDGTAKRNQSVKKMVIGAVRHCFLDQCDRCTFVRPENASSSCHQHCFVGQFVLVAQWWVVAFDEKEIDYENIKKRS